MKTEKSKQQLTTTIKDIFSNPVKRASYIKYEEGISLDNIDELQFDNDLNASETNDYEQFLSNAEDCTDIVDDLVVDQNQRSIPMRDHTNNNNNRDSSDNNVIKKSTGRSSISKSELGNWTPPSVGVRSRIIVDAIRDVDEEITVVVELVMHFRDPEAYDISPTVTSTYLPCDEKKLTKIPVLEILNVRKQRDINKRYFYETKTGVIFLIYEFRADIREVLDLRRFPFDRQIFKLEIRSFASKFERWSPEVAKPPRVADHPLWDDYEHLVSYDATSWCLEWSTSTVKHKHSSYTWNLHFGASRSPRFYMMNFVLVIFIVVAISTFTIAVEHNNFEGRSDLTFTLVLTLVAFKFTISSMVPRIDYQTYFDMYVLFSFMMLGAMIIENFFMSQLFFTQDHIPRIVDRIFAICYAGVWVLLHIGLFIGTYYNLFYEDWNSVRTRKIGNSIDNVQFLVANVTS